MHNHYSFLLDVKGQEISEGSCGAFNSTKNNKVPYFLDASPEIGEMFRCCFFGKLKTPKFPSEIS